MAGFKAKIEVKHETEAYITRKSNTIRFLQSKWENGFGKVTISFVMFACT